MFQLTVGAGPPLLFTSEIAKEADASGVITIVELPSITVSISFEAGFGVVAQRTRSVSAAPDEFRYAVIGIDAVSDIVVEPAGATMAAPFAGVTTLLSSSMEHENFTLPVVDELCCAVMTTWTR
jgi:hypothetical protein